MSVFIAPSKEEKDKNKYDYAIDKALEKTIREIRLRHAYHGYTLFFPLEESKLKFLKEKLKQLIENKYAKLKITFEADGEINTNVLFNISSDIYGDLKVNEFFGYVCDKI